MLAVACSPSVLIFAIRLTAGRFARCRFSVRPRRRLPFHAELLAIRDGRHPGAGRAGRQRAGGQADLPLPSVGRLRARPGAKKEFGSGIRNSEFNHGPHRNHRCFALRRAAGRVVCHGAEICLATGPAPAGTNAPVTVQTPNAAAAPGTAPAATTGLRCARRFPASTPMCRSKCSCSPTRTRATRSRRAAAG